MRALYARSNIDNTNLFTSDKSDISVIIQEVFTN